MDRQRKFFIVDDDPDFIMLVTKLLEKKGHTVWHSTSSVNALKEIAARQPDCVLLDIMMPETDGLELCKRLHGDRRMDPMKIIMVTAKAYEFDRERAFTFGADGYIVKPVDRKTFYDQLLRIMEDRIELTFWGVRGTLPVPGKESLIYGGSTSCITLEFSRGNFFIFDAGSGIKGLSDNLLTEGRPRLEAKIFISHPHWDHINALPFFVPLYMPGGEFEILGPSHGDITMRELISAQMDGVYFPVKIKEFGARVYFRDLKEGVFDIDGIVIKTMLLNHPGQCLGYRVEYKARSVCYVTDNELYLQSNPFYSQGYRDKLIDYVNEADYLITDTTYTDEEYESKIGWGHSCVGQVVDLAHRAKVRTLCLFHHDPDQRDADIEVKLKTAQALLEKKKSATQCLAPKEKQCFKL